MTHKHRCRHLLTHWIRTQDVGIGIFEAGLLARSVLYHSVQVVDVGGLQRIISTSSSIITLVLLIINKWMNFKALEAGGGGSTGDILSKVFVVR